LDEPVGHSGPWHLQISGNGWECVFNVSNADAARDFSAFVKNHANRKLFVEHRVGSFQGADVVVVKDSEFADRFWLRIRGAGEMVELTFQAENAVALEKALDDLVSDLST
jgi:hypothetical protein